MIRKYYWFALLTLTIGIIVGTNVQPGTWLSGWDNLHPEFNFLLAVKRSLFAVWQEYQGPGLVGGMGHAADLPRQLLLWLASSIIPSQLIRYGWTFAMLAAGAIGMYLFLERTMLPRLFAKMNPSIRHVGAFFGALFYLTNMATVQMFYAPFEAFTTHFGFLPWLFFAATLAVERPSKRTLLWFSFVTLLSLSQGYVPTVFVVYCLAILIWSVFAVLTSGKKLKAIRTVAGLWGITILLNAFWLLPFAYFTATSASVNLNAKINQMATDEVYLRNRAYGTILDTLQLKGFWFDTFDLNTQRGGLTPILGMWRELANKPETMVASALLFILVAFGAFIIFRDRKHAGAWIVALYVLCVTLLTTATPPFSWINELLRNHIPFFYQVFRFPFTKFSILAGFCYSLLFGIGLTELVALAHKRIRKIMLIILAAGCIVLQSYPILTGQLFYGAVKTQIPKDYFDLFSYLATKPSSWRIADLPQSTYWGWTYERWGYTGSGFLWYGISQPIMDRAFDVWSAVNENYYWELTRALYAKDPSALENVFAKYQIHYILVDKTIVSASNNLALFVSDIQELLGQMPTVRLVRTFGNLLLYERGNDTDTNFVRIDQNLPTVTPAYRWTDNDTAYAQFGDYVTTDKLTKQQTDENNAIVYPFRSLFTKRSVDEREFTVTENDKTITLSSPVEATSSAIEKTQSLVYDSIGTDSLNATSSASCGLLKGGKFSAQTLHENGQEFVEFTSINQRGCLSFDITTLEHKSGYIAAVETRHESGRPLLISLINDTARHVEVETYLGKATGTWTTDYFILPPLASDGLGYTVYLSNDSIGPEPTVNDVLRIRIYKIPYEEMVTMNSVHSSQFMVPSKNASVSGQLIVSHPNPPYYRVQLSTMNDAPVTLILSQSFDNGWIAVVPSSTFPFLVPAGKHVLVNNWENGWTLAVNSSQFTVHSKPSTDNREPITIYIFFWPQLLGWIGFALLPVPFLVLLREKH